MVPGRAPSDNTTVPVVATPQPVDSWAIQRNTRNCELFPLGTRCNLADYNRANARFLDKEWDDENEQFKPLNKTKLSEKISARPLNARAVLPEFELKKPASAPYQNSTTVANETKVIEPVSLFSDRPTTRFEADFMMIKKMSEKMALQRERERLKQLGVKLTPLGEAQFLDGVRAQAW